MKIKNAYVEKFRKNLENIEQLISTPNMIKDLALGMLNKINISELRYSNRKTIENLILSLKNISQTSIGKSYKIIYNQVCILAVSALSAVIEEYFVDTIKSSYSYVSLPEQIRVSLVEIQKEYGFDIKNNLGKIILKKDNTINFQDLQSIVRTFENYFSRTVNLDSKVKESVIFYQQCRHVLVHKNGIVDDEFLNRTKSLTVRKFKRYKKRDKIQLDLEDWKQIKNSFISLVQSLTNSNL